MSKIVTPNTIISHNTAKYWCDWHYFRITSYIHTKSDFIQKLNKEIKQ